MDNRADEKNCDLPDADLCGPPWCLFVDDGKPLAIMAAGRPGDVAEVEGMSMETAQRLVDCANAPIRDAHVRLLTLAEKLDDAQAIREQALRQAVFTMRVRLDQLILYYGIGSVTDEALRLIERVETLIAADEDGGRDG